MTFASQEVIISCSYIPKDTYYMAACTSLRTVRPGRAQCTSANCVRTTVNPSPPWLEAGGSCVRWTRPCTPGHYCFCARSSGSCCVHPTSLLSAILKVYIVRMPQAVKHCHYYNRYTYRPEEGIILFRCMPWTEVLSRLIRGNTRKGCNL